MKPLPLTAAAPAELPLQDGTVDLSAQIRFVADLAARAAIVVLFSMMAIRFGADFLATVAALASESVTVALSCVGLAIVIAGKAALGRSFALLPANRGIVSSGMYRLVRHPIYMGYLIAHVAYLLANPSVWNITALVLADAALLVRAVREEKTLALDPAYREYQQRVRWRVAPGIF